MLNRFGKSFFAISSIVTVPILIILSEVKKNESTLNQLNINKYTPVLSILTYCHDEEIKKNIVKEEKKEEIEVIVKKEVTNASNMSEEEAEIWWEDQKAKCSFCKHFLESPCTESFKQWHMCVDIAKENDEDFVSVCSEQTAALMNCTSDNASFFSAAFGGDENDDDIIEDGTEIDSSEIVSEKIVSNESKDKN